jgi:hypothetical protein
VVCVVWLVVAVGCGNLVLRVLMSLSSEILIILAQCCWMVVRCLDGWNYKVVG